MLLIKPSTLHVPQKTLRRLASRAEHVAAQYEAHPVLGIAARRVILQAQGYEETYDACGNLGIQRTNYLERCRANARTLRKDLRGCVAVLATELEFEPAEFTPETPVPTDVVAMAQRFIAFVESRAGTEATVPPEAIASLKAVATLTETEWNEGQRAAAQVQAMEQTLRDRAVEFHKTLVTFRRALLSVVGRRHVDYQTLRASRSQSEEVPEVVVDTATVASDSGGGAPSAEVAAE